MTTTQTGIWGHSSFRGCRGSAWDCDLVDLRLRPDLELKGGGARCFTGLQVDRQIGQADLGFCLLLCGIHCAGHMNENMCTTQKNVDLDQQGHNTYRSSTSGKFNDIN